MTEPMPERGRIDSSPPPRRARLAPLALGAALGLALGGCATNDYPELDASGPSASGAEASVPFDYVIGAGDELEIFVWGYPDLSVAAAVRPDGRITTRLVEDLEAAGRTPTDLAREIERRYAEYVTEPVVTVGVAGFVGDRAQQIRVIDADGEAESVAYSAGMTLLDLLVQIGGMGEFASGNRTVLVRGEGEARQSYSVRAGDLVRKADMSANVALRPGDIVVIPQSWF